MAITPRDDSSDYESSCSSSVTLPESTQSWLSNLSFGSRRSSVSGEPHQKPHKACQTNWQAMRRLQAEHNGQVGLDQFRLLRRVGGGDIGNVYLCQIRNQAVTAPPCFYAMKVVDREALAIRKKLQRAEMEKEILGMLDHPFLPTLYAEFDASHYSCLVMEFCPGGDLYAARQRLPSKRFSICAAKFYAAETLLALEYLHMMGIVYRDLKPENVLVREDGHIMLSDFDLSLKCDVVAKIIKRVVAIDLEEEVEEKEDGEAKNCAMPSYCSTPSCASIRPMKPVLSCLSYSTKKNQHASTKKVDQQQYDPELVAEPTQARSKSFVGTHEYLAPEVISGQGHGSAVDWWTLGVFLYELVYGITPFKGENNEKTLINILKKPLSFPKLSSATAKDHEDMVRVQDLISRLLVKNPKRRIGSFKGSTEIKKHDFFKGVNWALIRSVRPPEVPNDKVRSKGLPKLSRKDRDAPYQIPSHFDYF